MPIYDYICKDCQHEMEVLQKAQEKHLTKCPECQNDSLIKQVSAPRFRLGGSGWYETDEKPKSKQRNIASKDDAPSESKPNSDGTSKTSSGQESKTSSGRESKTSSSCESKTD